MIIRSINLICILIGSIKSHCYIKLIKEKGLLTCDVTSGGGHWPRRHVFLHDLPKWHSLYCWLWHCATTWKVAVSIPGGVIKCFTDNPSGRTIQYQWYLLGRGKGGRCLGKTTLAPACANCLKILEASNLF